ncbi:MAG: hypothetical protein PHN56_06665, partial [Candidatus Nanoarchaeia archaeon]|nr:hypothetical protein [Candidatus Nanoarchaeia archaeon]
MKVKNKLRQMNPNSNKNNAPNPNSNNASNSNFNRNNSSNPNRGNSSNFNRNNSYNPNRSNSPNPNFNKSNINVNKSNAPAFVPIMEDNFKGKIFELNEIIPSKYKTLDDFKKQMHEKLIKESIQKVKENITEQDLISIYVSYLDIMDEIINSYFERVSEHFTIFYPEASIKASMLDDFLKIKSVTKKDLSKLFNVSEESMGLDLKPADVIILTQAINGLKLL